MKMDEQYIAEFVALYEKHLTWNDLQAIDEFKAENGSLKEDDGSSLQRMDQEKKNPA